MNYKNRTGLLSLAFMILSTTAYGLEADLEQKIKMLESRINELEAKLNQPLLKVEQDKNIDPNELIDTTAIQEQKSKPQVALKKSDKSSAPKIEFGDKLNLTINGYVQADTAMIMDDKNGRHDGSNIRNARLNFSGIFGDYWKFNLQNNFASSSNQLVNAHITYLGFSNYHVTFGQMFEPFMMQESQAIRFLPLPERASITAFAPSSAIGVLVSRAEKDWSINAGVFGDSHHSRYKTKGDQKKSVTARVTYAPINDGELLLHLGTSGSLRKPHSLDKSVSYQVYPETNIAPTILNLTQEKAITNVESHQLWGFESALAKGPISLQTEVAGSNIKRKNNTVKFKGGYIQLGWVLTGEARPYVPGGVLGNVVPKMDFDPKVGSIGAWEIAARYNYLSLNGKQHGIYGGSLNSTNWGVNWYPNAYAKFMLDYALINADRYATIANNHPKVLMFRAQIGF